MVDKRAADVLVQAGIVITMDDSRRIIREASVVVANDTIVDLGKSADIDHKYSPRQVIDAKRKVVLPGLIGPHVHLVESFPRGFLNDLNWGEAGSKTVMERIWPYKLAMDREDVYYSCLLANLEMIRSGMTCFCDPAAHPQFFDEHFRATEEAGIRGVITRSNVTLSPPAYRMPGDIVDTPAEAIERTLGMIEQWQGKGEGRLRPWLGVRHIMSATEEFLLLTVEQQRRLSPRLGYRIGIKAHAAYSPGGLQNLFDRTGKREIEWLESLGILGPEWLLAHAILLSDAEVEILAKRDVKIVHCPGTSFACGYGAGKYGKFTEMLDRGMTVALAPDAGWCNNQLDMFLEMKHAAFLHKEAKVNGSVLPAERALEMATLHGARAVLWDDEIGSLKVGMKADLIVVDLWKPNSVPLHDHSIVKNIVYSTYGTQVETVICNGKIVMEKGRVKTLDEERILRRSQELAEGVVQRHPIKLKPDWPVI